jgi:hypothetical protein
MKRARYTLRRREVDTRAAYYSARARCKNPRGRGWKNYGGRGIEFRFTTFAAFADALKTRGNPTGLRPSLRHSVDRYPDPDGHYEPGNIRWATPRQQARNNRSVTAGMPCVTG